MNASDRLLTRLTDWAIPPDIREFHQREDIEHARAVCVLLLADVAAMALASLLAAALPLGADATFIILQFTTGFAATHAATLLVFRRTARFGTTAHLYAGSSYIVYVAALLQAPGDAISTLLIPLLAVPLFAAIIGGLRSGLPWILAVGLTPLAINLTWTSLRDLPPPLSVFYVGVWAVPNSSMTFALWCFEHVGRHMRFRLDEECARFAFDAAHDPLTGIANRSMFERRLTEALEHAAFNREVLALMYIDLNDFKPINDRHGHHAGDAALIAVAQRLAGVVRQSDTVARIGGDEFAVIYRHLLRETDVQLCVDRIHQRLAEPIVFEGNILRISASVGVVRYPIDGNTAEALQHRADALMYSAKQNRSSVA